MLFIFEQPVAAVFWMKDTLIPLDIHYFDAKGHTVASLTMVVEKDPSNPVASYAAPRPIVTAIETAPGAIKPEQGRDSRLCVEPLPH